jgi:uncharacterized protein
MPRLLRWIWGQFQAAHDETLEEAAPAAAPPAAQGAKRGRRDAPPPAARPQRKLDWRPVVILVTTAIVLTLQEYYGGRNTFGRIFPRWTFVNDRYYELWGFAWWSGWRVCGYLVVPTILLLLIPGEHLRDYGWSFKGFKEHIWTYVGLFAIVFPLVWLCSTTHAFQRIYPFYKLAPRSSFDLVAWELMYAAQFVALEFFFRGFMLHGMKRSLGGYSIWIMMVPYCMIHYGKTLPETLGAIIAGLTLGTISLRTRSIWGGIAIHIGVAWSMDLFALRHCAAICGPR